MFSEFRLIRTPIFGPELEVGVCLRSIFTQRLLARVSFSLLASWSGLISYK